MDIWQSLRWAHIAAGVIAFIVAPVALASAKGGPTHRRWGLIYVATMTFATISATVLAAIAGNAFFTFVGLFSFYLGFSGYRAVGKRWRIRWFDWVVAIFIAFALLAMLGYGTIRLAKGQFVFIPLIAFGIIGSIVVGRDLQHLIRPPADPHAWFFSHMGGMVSSAIAAMSAFSVTNLTFLSPVPRILWPAAVGTPLLIIWMRSYRRKFAAGRRIAEVATISNTRIKPNSGSTE